MDTIRAGVGAASGTVGALGGATYGGIKGLAEGYKTSGKGFKNTAKGMFSGAMKSGAEGAIEGGSKGFEMGANSKAAEYVTSKGVAKAASMVGNVLLPGSGSAASYAVGQMTDGYYGKGKKKKTPTTSDALDVAESITEGTTKKDILGHTANGMDLDLPDFL
jgi:hypothetical protein